MREAARQARPAVVVLALMVILAGILYPLAMSGIAQLVFPYQANGSLLRRADGTVVGSPLIGQEFTAPGYFHPRPSATLSTAASPSPQPYDAASSSGSNLGPTNKTLIQLVRERAGAYRSENHLPSNVKVPVDAVTASGSGLDPNISPANAALQAPRVAQARGVPASRVQALVARYTTAPTFGILGEPRVNVLLLNQALDGGK